MSATLEDLKDAGVMVTSMFSISFTSLAPPETGWIKVDVSRLLQTQLKGGPDCSCCTGCGIFTTVDLNDFGYMENGYWRDECVLSLPIWKEDRREFTFTRDGQQYICTVWPQICIYFAALCYCIPQEIGTI